MARLFPEESSSMSSWSTLLNSFIEARGEIAPQGTSGTLRVPGPRSATLKLGMKYPVYPVLSFCIVARGSNSNLVLGKPFSTAQPSKPDRPACGLQVLVIRQVAQIMLPCV